MNLPRRAECAFLILALAPILSVASGARRRADRQIVGGQIASLGQFPFTVALLSSGDATVAYKSVFCGGALVRPHYVATAGHCCKDVSGTLWVAAGFVDLRYVPSDRIRWAQRVLIHPSFRYFDDMVYGDICLLELNAPYVLGSSISTIDINSLDATQSTVTLNPGLSVTLLGWGDTNAIANQGQRLFPSVLQYAGSQLITVANATKLLRVEHSADWIYAMVAGGGVDSCQGDSGGPVSARKGLNNVLVGIVSWGVGCTGNLPGVYTNVTHFTRWMAQVMSDDPLCAEAAGVVCPEYTICQRGQCYPIIGQLVTPNPPSRGNTGGVITSTTPPSPPPPPSTPTPAPALPDATTTNSTQPAAPSSNSSTYLIISVVALVGLLLACACLGGAAYWARSSGDAAGAAVRGVSYDRAALDSVEVGSSPKLSFGNISPRRPVLADTTPARVRV